MSERPSCTAALAAALVPARAEVLLSRYRGAAPDEVRALVALPGTERLSALGKALRAAGPDDADRRSVEGTHVRAAVVGEPDSVACPPGGRPGRPALRGSGVLPFELPEVAPALLQLDGALLDLGHRVARTAASGLASVLGGEASISGRVLPGFAATAGAAVIPIELSAIAGLASLAVDRNFAARLAGQVAGTPATAGAGAGLTAAERAVVELAVLGALDAISAETGIESALSPRLALRDGVPSRPLFVELAVEAAGVRGRAILALPEAALRALRGPAGLPPALSDVPVPASVRVGEVELDAAEASALRPGDVLLLGGREEVATLLVDGHVVARGRVDGESLEIQEVEPGPGEGALTVPVRVELSPVSLPLHEIGRIAPGVVLPLGLDPGGLVTLRIGERAVARGELVDADGVVGVRISGVEDGT